MFVTSYMAIVSISSLLGLAALTSILLVVLWDVTGFFDPPLSSFIPCCCPVTVVPVLDFIAPVGLKWSMVQLMPENFDWL